LIKAKKVKHNTYSATSGNCSSWTKTPRNAYQWLLATPSILWLHVKLGVWQQMAMLTSIYIEPLNII